MEEDCTVSVALATGAKVSVVAVSASAEKRMFFMSCLREVECVCFIDLIMSRVKGRRLRRH